MIVAHTQQPAAVPAEPSIIPDWPPCNEGCDYEDPNGFFHDGRSKSCSCAAAKASIAKQRATPAQPPAGELPVLPDHPDPLTYRWSEAEEKAIREYGRLCRAEGIEEAAKAVEAIACPCCWTDDAIELAGTAIEDIRALNK